MEGCGDNFRKQVDEVEVDEGGKDGETRSKAEAKCRDEAEQDSCDAGGENEASNRAVAALGGLCIEKRVRWIDNVQQRDDVVRFELELKRLPTAVTTTVVLMRRRIIRKAKLSRRWEVEEEEKPVEGSVRSRLWLVKKRIRSSEADAEIKQHALLPTMPVKLPTKAKMEKSKSGSGTSNRFLILTFVARASFLLSSPPAVSHEHRLKKAVLPVQS
ncbi:hypothetical protein NDA10_002346 [Ustilago hordei]|uniref:Uncharacterized protein n=1 Tax=Ustilago hordei TaxID=120017 RepID=I2FV32_USTHO|nr:uncharacterized protein UHO2_06531 [Ustilago hordei]KAJ1040650.1 hypothetical protein NDA10_002346 [Ustilago hordei]UTT90372.1 hypothetical protein NDA17_002008 [Ustilago hordei]CCF50775.1 uncharacterized protein UHOR_06360 [Ustilago hordei]SYW77234.1 uncharacterized protein UHO2_06531 [Ustilago hordei]